MSDPWDALGARMLGPPHDDNRHSALPAAGGKSASLRGTDVGNGFKRGSQDARRRDPGARGSHQ